ncbi:MAG: molecular chaperone GroEL [Shimia sp.]|nr:molecular chaperone GroEL [Shimia sp.]
MTHAIESFFAAWGEADADTRSGMLHKTLSSQISYADPRTPDPITESQALIDYVGMYSQFAPGATAQVVVTGETAGYTRATVAFRMADGAEQLGQYFIELDDQSRISRAIGFAGLGAPE